MLYTALHMTLYIPNKATITVLYWAHINVQCFISFHKYSIYEKQVLKMTWLKITKAKPNLNIGEIFIS